MFIVRDAVRAEGSTITPAHPWGAFQFKDYAGPIFGRLRQMSGIKVAAECAIMIPAIAHHVLYR